MKESEVRDFIANNFSPFTNHIVNYEEFDNDLTTQYNEIITGTKDLSKILISDLIKLTIIDRLKQSIPILNDLTLIDKEYVLLKTPSGLGKQPSIDIMAFNQANYCLALIELKVSDSAEREAVTELSAYNQGLQNKFRGLSSLEVIWIPISTEWRTTTKSAIEFEMFWQNTLVMPLQMRVDYDGEKSEVNNVELKCFNPTNDLKEIECLNLFSYECFEAFDYCTMVDIEDKKSFVNYVTAICSRQKISGFVIFHKPVDMMYPYGFTLCVFNPYKGYLHKRLAQQFSAERTEEEFYENYKESGIINTDYTDIDFKTDEIKYFEPKDSDMDGTSLKHDAYWNKEFLSVGKFGGNSENPNLSFLFNRIKQMLDSNNDKKIAIGYPDFEGVFKNLNNSDVDSIIYLGVHLELISKRINLEHSRNLHNTDFFVAASSFSYLKDLFKEYNLK